MTFKVKDGINVGNINVIDSNARYQQVLGTPNASPSLNLDFINNPSLDSRFTISRTSNGTFVDSKGLVATATANTARFEYANGLPRGLLIENPRSNLATYSEDFMFSGYSINNSATRVPYATIAPDGSLTGTIWTSAALSASGFFRFVAGLSTATQYTQSIYIKNISGATNLSIGCDANPVAAAVTFNAVTGLITATGANVTYSNVTNVGNGWYRVSVTFTSTATNPSFICYSGSASAMSWATWGFQTEAGPNPTSYIPSQTTFTSRASLASYQDSTDNLIKYAGSEASRPVYNPLTRVNDKILTEPAATNLMLKSVLDATGWAYGAEVTINNFASPDGTTTAAMITVPAGVAYNSAYYLTGSTVTASTVYTWSTYVRLGTMVAADYKFAMFDITNSTFIGINLVPTVTPVNYEWRRITYTFTTPVGCVSVRPYYYRNDATGAGGTVYVWGGQLELGSYPTSYIPTIGSAVTRAADTFSVATTTRAADIVALSTVNWFSNIEGTWVVELDSSNWMNTPFIIRGDGGEYVTGRGISGIGTWNGTSAVNANPVTGANVASGVIAAVAYNSAGRAVSVNGVAPTTGSGAFSNSTIIHLGSLGSPGTRAIDGRIREVSFYPFAASNTQLQALTRL